MTNKDSSASTSNVSEVCASGNCEKDDGNICEVYSEWTLNACNSTSAFLPCED